MAKAKAKIKQTITLELDEEEAVYLRDRLQNPYGYENPEDEPVHDSVIRTELFEILRDNLLIR